MSNLQKRKESIAAALKEKGMDTEQGDVYISANNYHKVIKVLDIKQDKHGNIDVVYVDTEDWECTTWEKDTHTMALHSLQQYTKLEKGKTPATYYQEALDLIAGKNTVEAYNDPDTDVVESNTSLVSASAKQGLIAMQNAMEIKKQKAELAAQFVGLEMERRKREMDEIRSKLQGVVAVFQKKVDKIMKVIVTIELYLGIHEELVQIREGVKAAQTEPITFRQQVLYMDEEIGRWKDGGLDFRDIGWFDEWLVKDDNYKTICPEQKCMVVFRPRRHAKDYGDYETNSRLQQYDLEETYILIRNGEELYRIYTPNIVILPRLFPKRDELAKLMKELQGELESNSFYSSEKAKEKLENTMYQYKKRAVLMQGLIDRTEVFHPLPAEKINIFDMDALGDKVQFIYDDENLLPTGRLSFNDWQDHINSKIQHGSRIVVAKSYDKYSIQRRIYYYVANEFNLPPSPNEDIYTVENYEQEDSRRILERDTEALAKFKAEHPRHKFKETYMTQGAGRMNVYWYYQSAEPNPDLTILHNPKDTVYGSWGSTESGERKKRIRFKITQKDKQILNYDQISLEDIEFYLTSRVDRHDYLEMMPVLETMKKMRLAELEQEKGFVRFLVDRATAKYGDYGWEPIVWSYVEWWKFKNTWKRPIAKDDEKALRMIEIEIARFVKQNFNK